MDLIEIDDVIPTSYQDQLEAETTSDRMAWFYLPESARGGPQAARVEQSYAGFNHIAYHADDRAAPPSTMAALLLPLLYIFCDKARVPFKSLLRIRLGLFPRTLIDVPHHNPHVDFYVPHRVALYYVNDADGDTVIFNETFEQVGVQQSLAYTRDGKFTVAKTVSPKKGKMISFDGKHYHASMHPLKSATRIAIAFSFV